jgi:hypothetical protein
MKKILAGLAIACLALVPKGAIAQNYWQHVIDDGNSRVYLSEPQFEGAIARFDILRVLPHPVDAGYGSPIDRVEGIAIYDCNHAIGMFAPTKVLLGSTEVGYFENADVAEMNPSLLLLVGAEICR